MTMYVHTKFESDRSSGLGRVPLTSKGIRRTRTRTDDRRKTIVSGGYNISRTAHVKYTNMNTFEQLEQAN